jgi:hypothetical protein
MATTKSISANSTKNNSGSATNVGTSAVLNNLSLGSAIAYFGSVVIDGTDTDTATGGGTIAYNNSQPVGQRLTALLLSGAAVPSQIKSVNGIETVDTRKIATAIRAGYWNIYTGQFTTDPVVSYDSMHKSVTGTTDIDTAVHVSRSNTSKLTYLAGSKNPVNKSYDSKRG